MSHTVLCIDIRTWLTQLVTNVVVMKIYSLSQKVLYFRDNTQYLTRSVTSRRTYTASQKWFYVLMNTGAVTSLIVIITLQAVIVITWGTFFNICKHYEMHYQSRHPSKWIVVDHVMRCTQTQHTAWRWEGPGTCFLPTRPRCLFFFWLRLVCQLSCPPPPPQT